MLDVDVAVDHWLGDVEEEEHRHHREHESCEVPSDAHVELAIPFESGKRVIPSVGRRLRAEGDLLLSKTLDVLVHLALELRLDLVSLDELDYLLLLLV